MTASTHRKLILVITSLYVVATWISIAGMEIFGWLLVLLAVLYAIRKPEHEAITFQKVGEFLPWKLLTTLFVIVVLGLAINGTEKTKYVYDIGAMRWIFILTALSFAFSLRLPQKKHYPVFLIAVSVIAVYAVFQTITGLDLLRPGTNRAVQPLGEYTKLWRSAGLFGNPLMYAYIAGQHVCLPLAFLLLAFKQREKRDKYFWLSVLAYVLVSISIITTFTRGAWIAMAVAHLLMAFIVAPKIGISFLAFGATVFAVLFSSIETFRLRFLSLFDTGFFSNYERLFIWQYNWEMFKDYPILGIGYLENEWRAKEYVTRMGHPDAFRGHAHSNYLQMLAGTGITGLATYLALISLMLWLTWRLWKTLPVEAIWARALALACLGAQIQLHVGGWTECNFKAGVTNHNFMVVWAIVIALSVRQALTPRSALAIEKGE